MRFESAMLHQQKSEPINGSDFFVSPPCPFDSSPSSNVCVFLFVRAPVQHDKIHSLIVLPNPPDPIAVRETAASPIFPRLWAVWAEACVSRLLPFKRNSCMRRESTVFGQLKSPRLHRSRAADCFSRQQAWSCRMKKQSVHQKTLVSRMFPGTFGVFHRPSWRSP